MKIININSKFIRQLVLNSPFKIDDVSQVRIKPIIISNDVRKLSLIEVTNRKIKKIFKIL